MDYQKLFYDVINTNVDIYGARNVFSYLENNSKIVSITYNDFFLILKNLRAELNELNIVAGDRVAIMSTTTESYICLYASLAYIGIVAVPIDCNLPAAERNRLLAMAEVKALFYEPEFIDGIDTKDINTYVMERGCKYVKEGISYRFLPYAKSEPDVMAIMFSSGTTGMINGVEITYKAIWLSCDIMVRYSNIDYKETFINVLPPSHVAGYGTALSFIRVGACLCFLTSMNANNLLSAFQIYKPTTFEVVPEVFELMKTRTMAVINRKPLVKAYFKFATSTVGFFRRTTGLRLMFLTKPFYTKLFGPNIRIIGGGASPFSEDLIKFYLNLGLGFVNAYGSTEACFPISVVNGLSWYEHKGVGHYDQFKEIQIKINNPDENGIGEIFVKTELMMKGYLKNPELTKKAFDEDGWFKTGDLGTIDKDGVLYVKSRIKENIVLANGEKVTPFEIDEYYKLDNVKVACVGVMVEKGYDEIHLFIESDDESLVKNAVMKSAKAPKNYKIKEAHLVDKIPCTSTGKIKRFELRNTL